MSNNKKIIIYSTPTCVYCHMAKDWFKQNNIEYTNYDLSVDAEKRDYVIEKTGQMGVPVIEIDGQFVVGFDRTAVSKLLGL